jgi:hypothetical protein
MMLQSVSNQLLDGLSFKDIDLQDLQQRVKAHGQIEPLFQDGHEQVDADGNPYLGFGGIGRCAIERLNSQVLLDPFEEQLDLPSQLEDIRHGLCRDGKDVGQEHEALFCFGLDVGDSA